MATKQTDTATKRAAIEATITMPEGWNSEDTAIAEKTWSNVVMPLGKLTLDFEHGKIVEIDATQLSHDVLAQALMHGLKQKLVDAAAISRNPENGRAATIETKFDAVAEVAERLLTGEWNKRREGGPTGGLLKRALIEMYNGRKSAEQIEAFLAAKSDKEKAALRKNPKVAEIIERLRREDAAAKGEDAGVDLLAELEQEEEARDAEAGVESHEETEEQ